MYCLFSVPPPAKKFVVITVEFHSVFVKTSVRFVPIYEVSEISKQLGSHLV